MRRTLRVALFLVLISCGNRNGLSEHHARATAEALIATNSPRIQDFHHVEWKDLKQVSPIEARGAAVMVYRFPLPNGGTGEEHIPGTFVYHKKPGQGWVLDYVDFPNPNNLHHRLDQQVFVKVTSAKVTASAVEGQIPAPAVESPSREERDRQAAASSSSSADQETAASGIDVPLSSNSARRAVQGYLNALMPGNGTWSAKDFQPIRQVDGHELELPALLLVESAEDTLRYRGGFYFSYDSEAARWMLRRLSFRSEGSDPIEQSVATPVPVD